jgi:hypothetical protein
MDTKLKMAIPSQVLLYFLLCGGGLLAFFLVGLRPSQQYLHDLDQEIAVVESKIDAQKVLFPLYRELLGKVSGASSETPPVMQPSRLPVSRVAEVSEVLSATARSSGVELMSVVPDMQAIGKGKPLLPVSLSLTGGLHNLHRFLHQVLENPYVDSIEELDIRDGAVAKEFRVKLFFALQQG